MDFCFPNGSLKTKARQARGAVQVFGMQKMRDLEREDAVSQPVLQVAKHIKPSGGSEPFYQLEFIVSVFQPPCFLFGAEKEFGKPRLIADQLLPFSLL